MPVIELSNHENIIEKVKDCFYDFEGKIENNIVICEFSEPVFTTKCIEIFNKKSKNKYQCSKTDMKKHYKDVSIYLRDFNKLIESNDPKVNQYHKEGKYIVLDIMVKDKEGEKLIFDFDIFTQVRLACNRLEYEFGRKFKFMFYYAHPYYFNNIKIGIITTKN